MHTTGRHIRLILTAAILLMVQSVFAQEFTARADKTEVPLDGSFRITYSLENLDAKNFAPPDFDPFNAYGPNQSTSMSWVNGKMTKSVTYTYTLQPTAEGEFEIGPATAKVDGKLRKTNPVNIRVLAAGSKSQSNQQNGAGEEDEIEQQIRANLFVRVVPSKTRVYEGEQITLTYKLYNALSLDDLSIHKMPSFDGFLSYEIELSDKDRHWQAETYQGRRYNVQTIHESAIFASRSGTFRVEPMELTSMVLIRRNDPGYIWPRTERMKYEFKSNDLTIEVMPLPKTDRPATFTGAVGEYDFAVEYDNTTTQVDDPVTVKVSVSGSGNIKLIDLPDFSFPQSFDVYDPKIKETISKRSYTVNGTKTWEYLIIPRGGGSFQMPDISFSYFDLSSKEYVSRTEPGPVLEVEGEALSPQDYSGSGFSKEEVEMLGEDIRFIKTGNWKAAAPSANLVTRPLFHLLTWLPLALLAFLPVAYRTRKKRFGDTAALKSRKAHREAVRRMAAARKLVSSGDDKAFYNEVVKSVWGYLSDKFNIPAASLSRDNTRSVLEQHGISESLQDEVYQLIENCEMAVYAPMAGSGGKEGMVERATALLQRLDNEINAS